MADSSNPGSHAGDLGGPKRTAVRSASREWAPRVLWLSGAIGALILGWVLIRNSVTSEGRSESAALNESSATSPVTGCATRQSFYVTRDGLAENDGSAENPLDLSTALSGMSPARPCDTIWLRAGTYRGTFVSVLNGSEGRPITVRAYPGERVTLDSAPAGESALTVNGSWTWFWGLEITSTAPVRTSAQPGAWPGDLKRGNGVTARGSHLKFINLIVHDLARGFEIGSDSIDTEVYGSLIFYNGWEGPEHTPNGHGIDTRNRVGVRRLIDNVIFNQFSHGILAYGSASDPVHNVTIEGNILFNNGALSRNRFERDILIGGGSVVKSPRVLANVTYGGAQTDVGYQTGCVSGRVEDNVFGSTAPLAISKCKGVMKGNTMYGMAETFMTEYPDNSYPQGPWAGVIVRIRRNQYEPGRAHVAIFNWDKKPEVEIDLSDIGLSPGTAFEVRDAQNFFGEPLAKATYTANGKVTVPMSNLAVATAIGNLRQSLAHTGPEFAALVVITNGRPLTS